MHVKDIHKGAIELSDYPSSWAVGRPLANVFTRQCSLVANHSLPDHRLCPAAAQGLEI